MVSRIAWLLIIGAVFYGGYRGVLIALEHFTVVTTEQETPIEEQILLDTDFFFQDFGKEKAILLRTFEEGETFHIDRVAEPRPKLQELVARYGEPERVEDADLSAHGIRQEATLFYYGRLGLVSPKGQGDKIFWVIVR